MLVIEFGSKIYFSQTRSEHSRQSVFLMNSVSLLTDVSLNPRIRVGIGAYLVVPTSLLAISADRKDPK